MLVESHIDCDILDAEVQITDYNIYRSDRITRKQGGAIIYSHKSITIDDSEIYSDKYVSAMMIYSKHMNILLYACYRPPNAPEN